MEFDYQMLSEVMVMDMRYFGHTLLTLITGLVKGKLVQFSEDFEVFIRDQS